MKLIIISGVSGSGKSTALHVLEDQDYYCIDNLPVGLLPDFAIKMNAFPSHLGELAAVGIDARNPAPDLSRFPEILSRLRQSGVEIEVIYLDADDEVLLKRFSETRRKHPLSGNDVPLQDAIYQERLLMQPIIDQAALYIDTTQRNVHQLRDLIRERVQGKQSAQLSLQFESFGFKHGIATDADFVFDARCLPNPHWQTSLRNLSGQDKAVATFLENQPLVKRYFEQIQTMMSQWIPSFEDDNRSYLTIAIGCTGGQHRSVYLVEQLAQHFRQTREHVIVRHRDLH
jgi:RNase adapter protein RapZ